MIPSNPQLLDWNLFCEPELPSSQSAINLGLMNYNLFCEPAIANNAPNDLSFMFISWNTE